MCQTLNAKAKQRAPNPLKLDPTRTISIVRPMLIRLRGWFKALERELVNLILVEDAFGLKPVSHDPFSNKPTTNTRFAFSSSPEKIRAFQAWLKTQYGRYLRNKTIDDLWTAYILEGFKKGVGRAFEDTKQEQGERPDPTLPSPKLDFYNGTKLEFLRSAFGAPETLEKVKLLAGRTFDGMEGITGSLTTMLSRILTDGLVQGKNPRALVSELRTSLGITARRAETIARTELIRAHAEGQLLAFEKLGVEEVGAAVEWSTARDNRVCPLCRPLSGIVLKLDEAKGMIPRHPNCRCAWIPANVGEKNPSQLATKAKIESAIKRSAKLGGDKFKPGSPIAKKRPESILNTKSSTALDRFSELLSNMAPNQPRAKNGQWTKGANMAGGVHSGTSPSASHDLATADGLINYIKDNQGNHGFTELDFKKIKLINPNGIHQGKFYSPSIPVGKLNQEQIALFKKILPPGTAIKGKKVVKKDVDAHEAKMSGVPQPSTTHSVTPPPAPTPPPSSSKQRTFKPLPIVQANDLTKIGLAPGGSNGATIVKDVKGKEYILKSQNDAKHGTHAAQVIHNEVNADNMYRAAGVNVPNSGLVVSSTGHIGKRSDLLKDAQTLSDWEHGKSQNEIEAMHKKIGQHFVMDALMANWDVIGAGKDNIMIRKGEPIRVDNGGALEYRAGGYPKNAAFGPSVLELKTMRDPSINPNGAKVFSHLTEKDIQSQILDVLSKKQAILAATPSKLHGVMEARFNDLEAHYVKGPSPIPAKKIPLQSTNTPVGASTNPQTSIPVSSTLPTQPSSLHPGAEKVGNKPGSALAYHIVAPTSLVEKGGNHTYKTLTPEPTKKIQEWVAAMSAEEKAAVLSYTGSGYEKIRDDVAAGAKEQRTKDFISALDKAPGLDKPSIVYRGVMDKGDGWTPELMNQFKAKGVGAIVTENAHQSLTRDPLMAFANGGIFFQITSKTAKHIHDPSIHHHYGEQELLGLPNVHYRVTKIVDSPDEVLTGGGKKNPKMVVHLEEI